MAITKTITLIESRMARTAIEHLNETKPDYLLEMFREEPRELKKMIEHQVERAIKLKETYQKQGMSNDLITEMVNEYLADPEELPTEDVPELSQEKIRQIIVGLSSLR